MKKLAYLIGLSLMSRCFARTTEPDDYKIIEQGNFTAKILLALGTFVSLDGQITTRLDEACLLIARPQTPYPACQEDTAYSHNEELVQDQRDIFEVIFAQIDSLLHSSVYDINQFTQELARHFNHEFELQIFKIGHMNLEINLTNSFFRTIAHEAIKQNRLRIKLIKLNNILKTEDKIVDHIFELAGPNHQKSQFRIPLKPIFDIVAQALHQNPRPTNLAGHVTAAVNEGIDRIYA